MTSVLAVRPGKVLTWQGRCNMDSCSLRNTGRYSMETSCKSLQTGRLHSLTTTQVTSRFVEVLWRRGEEFYVQEKTWWRTCSPARKCLWDGQPEYKHGLEVCFITAKATCTEGITDLSIDVAEEHTHTHLKAIKKLLPKFCVWNFKDLKSLWLHALHGQQKSIRADRNAYSAVCLTSLSVHLILLTIEHSQKTRGRTQELNCK